MAEFRCPCCGSAMGQNPKDVIRFLRMTPLEREVIGALVDAYPKPLTRRQIAGKAYESDPSGGPETAEDVVSVIVSRMRPRLGAVGWRTVSKTHTGIRLAPVGAA